MCKGVFYVQYESNSKRLWRLISPIILYYGITFIVSIFGSMIVTLQIMQTSTATDEAQLMDELFIKAMDMSVPVVCISAIITIPLLLRSMRKDRKLYKTKPDLKLLKKSSLIYCFLAGIFGSVAGSIVVTVSQMGEVFEGYEAVATEVFSYDIILQLVVLGIAAPLVEELIYRGLIYQRLKGFMNVRQAFIISSLLFGLTHGNFIQAVYGFAMGLLLAYVYEKYKTLAAPILCHCGANLISVVLSVMNITIESIWVPMGVAIGCLLLVYVIINLIHRFVQVPMIPNELYVDIGVMEENHNSDSTGNYSWRHEAETETKEEKRTFSVEDYYPKRDEEE